MMDQETLWYRQPAVDWVEALPLGNGRIGAMQFGGVDKETLSLNEDTLWSGFPEDHNLYGRKDDFRTAQRLALEGKLPEAQRYVEQHLLSRYSQGYLPLGDLTLTFAPVGKVSNYVRSLDLRTAIGQVCFDGDEVHYERRLFVSQPQQALYLRLSASQSGKISFSLAFSSPLVHQVEFDRTSLLLNGICPTQCRPSYAEGEDPVTYSQEDAKKGIRFAGRALVRHAGGQVKTENGVLTVENADEVVLIFCVRTSFNGFDRSPYLQGVDEKEALYEDMTELPGFTEAMNAHIADYQALYNRVKLDLGDTAMVQFPTDVRLKKQSGENGLIELMYNFGRYLLISSSRPGTQATNLQGIWNKDLRAAWSGNYTININTEMNYWPVESSNLTELHQPLFDLIAKLRSNGQVTARETYGARGAVVHHNSDIWGLTSAVGESKIGAAGYAFWNMSFGWMCEHLMEHYRYTLDEAFLREVAYPAIRDAALFYMDTMAQNENGEWAVCPTTSPENTFFFEGKRQNVAKATGMSQAIAREVLENYIECAALLEAEDADVRNAREVLAHLMPVRIGTDGRIMEWDAEYEETELTHRHVSHLYALHPAHQITPDKTPDFAEACKKTLNTRGDDGTGWSLGWKINMWARLWQGDHALKLLKRQLNFVPADETLNFGQHGGTYLNLFDAHPPFQIDGNFGMVAGVNEMLAQSRPDGIFLLPALPSEWKNGSIRGLCVYGGVQMDLEWKNGALCSAVARKVRGETVALRFVFAGKEKTVTLEPGQMEKLL